MTIPGIVAVLLVAVVAVCLLAPLRVELEWSRTPGIQRVRVRTRWMFFVWMSGKARPRRRPEKAKASRPPTRSAGTRRRRVLAALATPGFLPRAGRLLLDVGHVLVPRTVEGWLRVGLEDPMSTGLLFGAANAAAGWARAAGWKLHLEPEFAGPLCAGQARVRWEVRPGSVLWSLGTFVASPVTWRAAFAAVRRR